MARNLGVPYTDEKPYYFVSYNSEDESTVAKYAKEMSKLNIPMWYDNGLKVGEEWEVEIAAKIENCQAVIMFLSKRIFEKESSYVHKEFELATEYSMKKVYVMMLDEIVKPDVPVRFRGWWTSVSRLHCINTYEHGSPEESALRLAEGIGLLQTEKNLSNNETAKALLKSNEPKNTELANFVLKFYMCAQAYDLELNDTAINFIKWLFMNMDSVDDAYKMAKGILSLSNFLISTNICQSPIYHIGSDNNLQHIRIKLEADNKFKEKDLLMGELYSSVMMQYCKFVAENKD